MSSILDGEIGKASREDAFELPHSEPVDSPQNTCTACGNSLSGRQKRFCSKRCRDRHNMKVYRAKIRKPHYCIICGNVLGNRRYKTCSEECRKVHRREYAMKLLRKEFEDEEYHQKYLEYHRQYRIKNKDMLSEKDKKKRAENPEKFKERRKRYNQYNKEQRKNAVNRRRALKQKIIETFDRSSVQTIIDSCNGICPNCGKEGEITLDHILPISKAPKWYIYTIEDVQPLCRSCNSSKGTSLTWMENQ